MSARFLLAGKRKSNYQEPIRTQITEFQVYREKQGRYNKGKDGATSSRCINRSAKLEFWILSKKSSNWRDIGFAWLEYKQLSWFVRLFVRFMGFCFIQFLSKTCVKVSKTKSFRNPDSSEHFSFIHSTFATSHDNEQIIIADRDFQRK